MYVLDKVKNIAGRSNKIKGFVRLENKTEDYIDKIKYFYELDGYLVLFPTSDLHLELLNKIYYQIKDFCFIPFNQNDLIGCLSKGVQYQACEAIDVPYPKSVLLKNVNDLGKVDCLKYPILIKPEKRDDLTAGVFRNLFCMDQKEYLRSYGLLSSFIGKGVNFLCSEFIPGGGDQIYAYTGYRSKQGKILNEWSGRKLSQFPNDFGVFSSASNEAPQVVVDQGRALLEKLNLFGICEPEFKYDERDGKYKLMEINLRSMMWNRVGNLSGVDLQYTQYCDATGRKIEKQIQNKEVIHFVYMKHEIINLISRKDYWPILKYNVFGSKNIYFAVFDKTDFKPFLWDLFLTFNQVFRICLKRLLMLLRLK